MGRLRPRLSAEGGFTLVETLVTMLVLLVMLAAIQRVLFAGFTTFMFGQDNYESQASVELAHKYLDRSLREARSVVAADPGGRYVAVLTDANNDGEDELLLYFVDYNDGKLKEYTDLTPYEPGESYDFSTPSPSAPGGLVETDIIANIVGNEPTANQTRASPPILLIPDGPSSSSAMILACPWTTPPGPPGGSLKSRVCAPTSTLTSLPLRVQMHILSKPTSNAGTETDGGTRAIQARLP